MKQHKNTERIGSWVSLIIVVIIVAIISFLSHSWFNTRVDLTEEKRFSLNPSTQKLIQSLEETLIIKCYFSKDLPSQFTQARNSIVDFLADIKSISKNQVQVIYIDPEGSKELVQEAQAVGIQQVQLQGQSGKSLEIKKGYFGVVMTYGEKQEVLPVINDVSFFEYNIILRLKKLLDQLKTVGIVQGENEHRYIPDLLPNKESSFKESFSTLYSQLSNLYNVKMLNLKIDTFNLSDSIDVLILVGSRHIAEKQQKRIDYFLNQGGSVLAFVPRIKIDNQRGITGSLLSYNYEPWLEHYGFKVDKRILLDSRYFKRVNFSNSIFPKPYPYWVVIPTDLLNKQSIITKRLTSISFPWTSFLDLGFLLNDQKHLNVTHTVLANSSDNSWVEESLSNLQPKEKYKPTQNETRVMAILREGKFKSFYTNPNRQSIESKSRLMVIPNLFFVSDIYLKATGNREVANVFFVSNAVDQLASDEDLISLRNRYIPPRAINEFGRDNKNLLVILNLTIVPVLFILLGIFIAIRTQRKQLQ